MGNTEPTLIFTENQFVPSRRSKTQQQNCNNNDNTFYLKGTFLDTQDHCTKDKNTMAGTKLKQRIKPFKKYKDWNRGVNFKENRQF